MYNTYKKLIEMAIERGELTPEFVEEKTKQLDYYLKKGKLTKKEYDELITLMNLNEEGV